MPTAKLSSKPQIVIPAEVRRALGLSAGDELRVEVEGERIILTKERPESSFERLRAFVGDPVWTGAAEELERSRDEWEEYSGEIERIRARDAEAGGGCDAPA